MPEADYVIRQGDFGQAITATAENAGGAATAITSATVRFVVTPIGGGTAIVDRAAANLDVGSGATRGQMSYTWQTGDTATAGFYLAYWKVTFLDNTVQTFPNSGYLRVQITAKP